MNLPTPQQDRAYGDESVRSALPTDPQKRYAPPMPVISPDFYEVLDVPPRADRATLARAWRSKRDRVESLRREVPSEDAEALCAKLDEAFAILSNPRRESRYLEYLRASEGGAVPPVSALFGGLEFDAEGATRRSVQDPAERNGIIEALLDPPPWGAAPDAEPDAAMDVLATPSTEWELDQPPGTGLVAPAVESGSRSAVRPNLPAASANRAAREHRLRADERLLRAPPRPPWS